MSRRKYSEFRLQREREEKLRLLQTLGNLHAEAEGLKERVAALVGGASEGLRSTFASETQRAQRWLSQLRLPHIKGFSMDSDAAALRATQTQLEQAAEEGRRIQEALTIVFTQKADQLGRRLAGRLAEVEQLYLGRQQLLKLWFGERTIQEWEQRLQEVQQLLKEEHYAALEPMLSVFQEEIAAKSKIATEQEDKHQKRLYLLKALRQVSAEMGFEEVSPPRYEWEGDRSSRILFTVDTLDRGKIQFTLSLDGISSFSEVAEDRCFEEFDQLSEYLEEEFGIQTEFRREDGTRPPKLIRKGEMDLPGDAGKQARASGFVLFQETQGSVFFRLHPCDVLRLEAALVAIQEGRRATLYRYDDRARRWLVTEEVLALYHPVGENTYAMVV